MSDKLCTICSTSVAKYKCPKCKSGYCSVGCYKIHKTEPCTQPLPDVKLQTPTARASAVPETTEEDEEEEKHRLNSDDLKKLGASAQVKELLADPQVRALMESVHSDPDPVQAVRILRQRADFEQLVQAMLEATDSQK
ncbi:Zinc finger HIT domain-containing protein 3 [Coemansia erecta]|nr:Zinc finger HIT domain-containing protein 3 [Coemansia erecta]